MAYTGTGTLEDPFVVSTFADFLTCVGDVGTGAGAYVKIACDLDAAAEGYEYIGPITVEAASVYADDVVSIKNVTIAGTSMLKAGTTSTAHSIGFRKIHFENWTLKNETTSSAICLNLTRTNSTVASFEDCEMNFEVQGGSRSVTFTNMVSIYHCSVYLVVYSANGFTIEGTNSSSTQLVKSNLYFKLYNSTRGSGNFLTSLSYSGIIIDGLTFNQTTIGNFCNQGGGFGYVVFKDCTVSSSCALTSPKTTNLICLDNTTGITSSASPIVTPEQLKSESYLQSIGWLP